MWCETTAPAESVTRCVTSTNTAEAYVRPRPIASAGPCTGRTKPLDSSVVGDGMQRRPKASVCVQSSISTVTSELSLTMCGSMTSAK